MLAMDVSPYELVDLEVQGNNEYLKLSVASGNLSTHGVFLYTPRPIPAGTKVTCVLHLPPEFGDVAVDGRVVQSVAWMGMGIAFQKFEGGGDILLNAFTRSTPDASQYDAAVAMTGDHSISQLRHLRLVSST